MSKDWVTSYLSSDDDNFALTGDAIANLALSGAPRVFKAVQHRVESDLKTFEGKKHAGLVYEPVPSNKFIVRTLVGKLPYARIEVELAGLTVTWTARFKHDDTCDPEERQRSFRIKADLSGNVQLMRNGTPFEDESEASEELLRPVFEFLTPVAR